MLVKRATNHSKNSDPVTRGLARRKFIRGLFTWYLRPLQDGGFIPCPSSRATLLEFMWTVAFSH